MTVSNRLTCWSGKLQLAFDMGRVQKLCHGFGMDICLEKCHFSFSKSLNFKRYRF